MEKNKVTTKAEQKNKLWKLRKRKIQSILRKLVLLKYFQIVVLLLQILGTNQELNLLFWEKQKARAQVLSGKRSKSKIGF